MDKLIINLDEYQKISKGGRIFNVILGSGLILLSALVIYKRTAAGQSFGDYLFFVILALIGLNILLYTFGIYYRISRRYVVLDNKGVEYKLSYFYPSNSFKWEDLKKVEIKTLRIYFYKAGGSSSKMKLGEIYYSDIKRLKKTLAGMCTEKGIEWSDTTVESELAGRKEKEAIS
ncbi:MAG: hypothetical protein R6U58_12820 [Bacteroidales bacterium]